MFGFLDQFWPPIVPPYSTEDTVRIGNSFITIPVTRNYIQSQLFLSCYTCTQLTITYTFVTTITCSTLARLHSLRALHSNLYCTIAHKVSSLTQCVFTGWLLSFQFLSQIIIHFASSHFPCLSPIETSLVELLLKLTSSQSLRELKYTS
jgi:hypothetical protein